MEKVDVVSGLEGIMDRLATEAQRRRTKGEGMSATTLPQPGPAFTPSKPRPEKPLRLGVTSDWATTRPPGKSKRRPFSRREQEFIRMLSATIAPGATADHPRAQQLLDAAHKLRNRRKELRRAAIPRRAKVRARSKAARKVRKS